MQRTRELACDFGDRKYTTLSLGFRGSLVARETCQPSGQKRRIQGSLNNTRDEHRPSQYDKVTDKGSIKRKMQ
jgi:hypothetical protein